MCVGIDVSVNMIYGIVKSENFLVKSRFVGGQQPLLVGLALFVVVGIIFPVVFIENVCDLFDFSDQLENKATREPFGFLVVAHEGVPVIHEVQLLRLYRDPPFEFPQLMADLVPIVSILVSPFIDVAIVCGNKFFKGYEPIWLFCQLEFVVIELQVLDCELAVFNKRQKV
jgi:hypothetical protein